MDKLFLISPPPPHNIMNLMNHNKERYEVAGSAGGQCLDGIDKIDNKTSEGHTIWVYGDRFCSMVSGQNRRLDGSRDFFGLRLVLKRNCPMSEGWQNVTEGRWEDRLQEE